MEDKHYVMVKCELFKGRLFWPWDKFGGNGCAMFCVHGRATTFTCSNCNAVSDAVDNVGMHAYTPTNLFGSPADSRVTTALEDSAVVKPSHYRWHPTGLMAWDITEYFNHNLGSAIDYLWRCGKKGIAPAVQDLKKAIQWIQHEIDRVEREDAAKKKRVYETGKQDDIGVTP